MITAELSGAKSPCFANYSLLVQCEARHDILPLTVFYSSLDNPGSAKHGIVQIDDIECLMGIPREQIKLFLQKSINEGIIQGCCRTGSSQKETVSHEFEARNLGE